MEDAPRATAGWGEWAPWIFVAGVAAYLASRIEPDWRVWSGALGGAVALALFARWRGGWGVVSLALVLTVFLAGAGWTAWVAHRAPGALAEAIDAASVTGRVESLELRANGIRVVLADAQIAGRADPIDVRVLIPTRFGEPRAGELIGLTARLSPPLPPLHPDGFDLPRRAWFQGLGAVGFALSDWRTLAPPPSDIGVAAFHAKVESWRQKIRQRILAAFPSGDARAGVAAALVIGDTGAIPQNVMRDYRESGIAHMLSISGLHMSLFAGLAFLVMRRGLALIPALALRHPIKKWAAAFALLLTTFYLLLSGASVPTQRAWMMTTIALTAIMLDRSPFSLRLVGVAALVVAIRDPESVVGPSFQMSFGAVVALISAYQLAALRFGLFDWPGWLRWPLVTLGGTLASTMIATLATAPFALYHFGRIAVHSLPANLLGVPPLGLWVMPWGVISILAMPFGLEALPLRCMAWGIGWIDAVAARVASWPGHLLEAAQMPDFGLALCAAGGLWLCLGFGRTRWLAALAVIVGMASPWMRPPPDVMIADEGAAIAVREAEAYGFLGSGRTAFLRAVWRGQTALPVMSGKAWVCDAEGCAATAPRGWKIARSTAATLGDDCSEAALVVARFAVPEAARAACGAVLFDADDLARSGALAIWLDGEGRITHLDSVALRQGRRPWGAATRGDAEDDDIQ